MNTDSLLRPQPPHLRLQTAEEAAASITSATWPRVGFAAVMAALSLAVVPLWLALAWVAAVFVWDIALRPQLHAAFALPAAKSSQQSGFAWLAAINFVGSILYTAYPAALWTTGDPACMVLATAWICASANHLFVYCSSNRVLLMSGVIPLMAIAIGAPLLTSGLSLESAVSISALGVMVLATGVYGFDRHTLLDNISKHRAARADAEQANAAKSQFLATMSHELRTPLNAVIGYAELIEEEAERGSIAEDAAKIRSSARQLLGVIDVILDLSKLESGAIELQRERGSVSAILEQLREAAGPLAAAGNNKTTIAEVSPLGEAEVDHMRLYQGLMQLLLNAAKFTTNGEIRVSAARQVEDGRYKLVFTVADTGIGIAAADQTRIFEPFVQADAGSARTAEGAGLGLALVRRLARLMGGDVGCESTPGVGSTFTLWVDAGPAS